MLNVDGFRLIHFMPGFMPTPKKKKRAKRKTVKVARSTGKDIFNAVSAAIKEEGPVCVTEIVNMTGYSTTSVGYWIEKLKSDDLLVCEKRQGVGKQRRVTYYSFIKGATNVIA